MMKGRWKNNANNWYSLEGGLGSMPSADQASTSVCEYLNKVEHKLPLLLNEQQKDGK